MEMKRIYNNSNRGIKYKGAEIMFRVWLHIVTLMIDILALYVKIVCKRTKIFKEHLQIQLYLNIIQKNEYL